MGLRGFEAMTIFRGVERERERERLIFGFGNLQEVFLTIVYTWMLIFLLSMYRRNKYVCLM